MISLRTTWRSLLLLGHILIGVVLTLGMSLFQREGHPHPAPGVVQWWHRGICRRLHLRVRVQGELPKEPLFIVSNHISWMDIHVLGALGSMCFVSKLEVRHWPIVGWLAARAGTLFIRRGGGQTDELKQQMMAQLGHGNHIVLFPEGTTTDGSDVRPFFPRLFALVQETGVSVQPLALRYTQGGELSTAAPFIGDDELLSSILRVLRQDAIEVDVRLPATLALSGSDRKTLANSARTAIVDALQATAADSRPAA